MAQVGRGERAVTPTLAGRWQTRLALALLVGVPLTLLWSLAFGVLSSASPAKLFVLLGYATALGLLFDPLWIALQNLRWDRDWPLAFQFLGGCLEGSVLFALFSRGWLPGAPWMAGDATRFGLHYGSVLVGMLLVLLGPMRVLFPTWRFRGGRVL